MKINCDYVLIRIDDEYERWCGTVKNEHGEEIKLVLNPHWRPTHNAKISGKVLAVPEYLSDRDLLYEQHQGSPRPAAYRSHDRLWKELLSMPPKYRKNHNLKYSAAMGTPEFQTLENVPIEVQIGDTIYFHYNNLLDPTNYWKRDDDGSLIYKIPYASIFCYVRKEGDDPVMINGYCLVTPYFDEKADKIEMPGGYHIFGKLKNNLVVSLGEKPKYLTGVLRHIGAKIGTDTRDLLPGDLIMYAPKSEFVNVIEGLPYYVMRAWDIIAIWMTDEEIKRHTGIAEKQGWKLILNQITPVGDYVMLTPDPLAVGKSIRTIVYDPTKNQIAKPGELFVPESAFDLTKKKRDYKNGIGSVVAQGERCSKDRKEKNVMYEKASSYLYVEEFNVVFIRDGDIYGTVLDIDDKNV